ncbi:uncharacterized protein LOC143145631 [Ptiloglossa arizonensis]|uniref:uncharacterized protein LOC143145631 n=1 Tax=Ptiloglossa arizonensis TaxID=3350558 RepID=UPI003F9EBF4A
MGNWYRVNLSQASLAHEQRHRCILTFGRTTKFSRTSTKFFLQRTMDHLLFFPSILRSVNTAKSDSNFARHENIALRLFSKRGFMSRRWKTALLGDRISAAKGSEKTSLPSNKGRGFIFLFSRDREWIFPSVGHRKWISCLFGVLGMDFQAVGKPSKFRFFSITNSFRNIGEKAVKLSVKGLGKVKTPPHMKPTRYTATVTYV